MKVGTLGWFGTRESDNAPILLSNQHVLYPIEVIGDKFVKDGDKVAQPLIQKKSCCETNVIGNTLVGIFDDVVDCAIAKLNDSKKVNLIITNKATPEVLKVKGTAQAVVGTGVKKIGSRSAFTKGIVVDIGAVTIVDEKITLPDGTQVKKRKDQIL